MKIRLWRLLRLALSITGLIFAIRSFKGEHKQKFVNLLISMVCISLSNIDLTPKKAFTEID